MKHKGILSSVNGTTLTLSLLQFGQMGRRIQKKKKKKENITWEVVGVARAALRVQRLGRALRVSPSFSEFLGVSLSFAGFGIRGAQRGGKKSFGHLSNLWADLEPALGKSTLSAGRERVETNC